MMARGSTDGEKPLDWVGSSKKDFLAFPASVKDEIGAALGIAQFGGKHPSAKPWKGLGSGVFELVENQAGNAYRVVYVVRFPQGWSTFSTLFKRSRRAESGRPRWMSNLSRSD